MILPKFAIHNYDKNLALLIYTSISKMYSCLSLEKKKNCWWTGSRTHGISKPQWNTYLHCILYYISRFKNVSLPYLPYLKNDWNCKMPFVDE